MTSRVRMRSVLFLLAAAAGSACGVDPRAATNPAAPSLFTPPIALVAGQWKGTGTLVGGNNGGPIGGILGSNAECLGNDVTARLPLGLSDDVALTVSQDGAAISGVLTTASGVACTYKGTASQSAVTMASATCEAPTVVVRCENVNPPGTPPLFPIRELELAGSSVSGAVTLNGSVGTMNGTLTNTYNIRDQDDNPVGSLVLKYAYSVNR